MQTSAVNPSTQAPTPPSQPSAFCGICKDDVTNPCTLPCRHIFCTPHIGLWLRNGTDTCPLCRRIVPSTDIAELDVWLLLLRLPPYEDMTLESLDGDIRKAICGLYWAILNVTLAAHGCEGFEAKGVELDVLEEKMLLQGRRVAMLFQVKVDALRNLYEGIRVSVSNASEVGTAKGLWHTAALLAQLCGLKMEIWYNILECRSITGFTIDHIPWRGIEPPPPSSPSTFANTVSERYGIPLWIKSYDFYASARLRLGFETPYACPMDCDHGRMLAAGGTREDVDEMFWGVSWKMVGFWGLRVVGVAAGVLGVCGWGLGYAFGLGLGAGCGALWGLEKMGWM